MIVELANKFRFEVDEIREIINANRVPSLHMHIGGNISKFKSDVINKNFDGMNLSSIKIFEDEKSTIPIEVFNKYTTLTHFEKAFSGSGSNGEITIILSVMIKQE